jgi:hypothetical protein
MSPNETERSTNIQNIHCERPIDVIRSSAASKPMITVTKASVGQAVPIRREKNPVGTIKISNTTSRMPMNGIDVKGLSIRAAVRNTAALINATRRRLDLIHVIRSP